MADQESNLHHPVQCGQRYLAGRYSPEVIEGGGVGVAGPVARSLRIPMTDHDVRGLVIADWGLQVGQIQEHAQRRLFASRSLSSSSETLGQLRTQDVGGRIIGYAELRPKQQKSGGPVSPPP
jgi:hypothetical protein